ncbi:MAG: TonB-dependent siderophore receptor [Pseudomonas sp.]|uniref:TonB-dependent siderophore receptor n=1 Tax=Pseudomonas sp. TaxID=306 RepID=UPI003390AB3E
MHTLDISLNRTPRPSARHPLAIAVLGVTLAMQGLAQAEDKATPQATLQLDAVSVTDHQLTEITEGSGSYTTGATRSATKLALSPRETPQSVTVITRQMMDDQGISSLSDALSKTPGITVTNLDTNRATFKSRGFDIDNVQVDGIPAATRFGNSLDQTDLVIFDRVEVLKGANGLLSGFGSPAATINLVRKRPTSELSGYVSTSAGSWDTYRGEFDIGGRLTDSGNLRGRFVSAYEDGHSFQDHYQNTKEVLYGVLDFDLTPDTLLSVGINRQQNRPQGSSWGPNPLLHSDGSETDFSRSFNPATDWSNWGNTSTSYFASVEQQLANAWSLKLAFERSENDAPMELGSAGSGNPNAADGSGMYLWLGKYRYESAQNSLDLFANGPFQLLGREHELVVGVSHRNVNGDDTNYSFTSAAVPDIFNWHGDFAEPDWGSPVSRAHTDLKESAAYTSVRFKPADDLSLILGARLSNWDLQTEKSDYVSNLQTAEDLQETGVVVPYAGLVYDLSEQYSVYASYTSIFKPHESERDLTNTTIEPEEGDSFEVGVKGEFFEGRLNTSLALFEIQQDNLAELTGQLIPGTANFAYRAIAGAKTRGLELEASGELAPGWQVLGGYTHRITRDGNDDKISTTSPEDLFRVSTTYQLPGNFEQWTVGGGLNWQSKIWTNLYNPATDGDYEYTQKSYVLVDAMAKYDVTDDLSLTLNGNNLTNKKYFNNLGFYGGGFYGDPRNLTLTGRWSF